MIKFHFYNPLWYEVFAHIICFKTNSDYSHCVMYIRGLEEPVYQSRLHTGLNKYKTIHRTPNFTINMPFDKDSDKGKFFIKHMDSLVGSKYGIIAALFSFFGRKIQNDNEYICSRCIYQYFPFYLGKEPKLKTSYSPKDIILMSFGNEIDEDEDEEL